MFEDVKQAWEALKLAHGKESNFSYKEKEIVSEGKYGDKCTILKTEYSITYVFHGSDDPLDWIRNFDTKKTRDKKYVRGFYKPFLNILARIKLPELGDNRDVFVTGYSRGGPLAQYFYEHLLDVGVISKCFTFASPQGFDKKYVKKHKRLRKILNFKVEDDIVPRVPVGYTCPGKTIKLGKQTWYEKLSYIYAIWKGKGNILLTLKAIGSKVGKNHSYLTYNSYLYNKYWN